jgi:AcrR family transcriptional regulator
MGLDARRRYTNMVIRNSFVQLLREKPLRKVRVADICVKSKISRATFYKYYANPYDLLKQMEAELVLDLQKSFGKADDRSVAKILIVAFDKLELNADVCLVLLSDYGDSKFSNQVFSVCYEAAKPELLKMLPKVAESQREWFLYLLFYGGISIISHWLRIGIKEDSRTVFQFIKSSIMISLNEFQNNALLLGHPRA